MASMISAKLLHRLGPMVKSVCPRFRRDTERRIPAVPKARQRTVIYHGRNEPK